MSGDRTWRRHPVGDAQLEVLELGAGDPVVLVQTALTADHLLPLTRAEALEGWHRVVYHRRGYAGSSPLAGPGSIPGDARDCARLLTALGIDRAHVVGASYAGAVALELAATETARVRSLVLIEPPPVHTASGAPFRAANDELVAVRRRQGTTAALDRFLSALMSPDWKDELEGVLPGAVEQAERDAATFFDSDLPGLLAWDFGPAEAARITCPVLHIGGSESGPWFDRVRREVLGWFPRAGDVVIDGAGHELVLTHADDAAEAIRVFLERVG